MNMRTLALRLACLPEEDQRWVLSQLPVEHSASFQQLRDEVVALGLNTDPSVIAQLNMEREQREDSMDIDLAPNSVDGSALDLPSFWKTMLNGETRIVAFEHSEKLPPAMRANLARLAVASSEQRS